VRGLRADSRKVATEGRPDLPNCGGSVARFAEGVKSKWLGFRAGLEFIGWCLLAVRGEPQMNTDRHGCKKCLTQRRQDAKTKRSLLTFFSSSRLCVRHFFYLCSSVVPFCFAHSHAAMRFSLGFQIPPILPARRSVVLTKDRRVDNSPQIPTAARRYGNNRFQLNWFCLPTTSKGPVRPKTHCPHPFSQRRASYTRLSRQTDLPGGSLHDGHRFTMLRPPSPPAVYREPTR